MRGAWHAAGNQLCRKITVWAGFALGLLFFAPVVGCDPDLRNPALNDASSPGAGEDHTGLVPRVPSHNPSVSLYGQVRNLAFGSTVTVVANHVSLPPIARNGIVRLLNDVPIGTIYDVSLPINPRGQVCTIAPLHGAVGPQTAYVDILCRLSVVTANDVNDTVVIGQPNEGTVIAQTPPDQTTMLMPRGKVFANIDGTLYAADRGNHRVLGYYPAPVSGAWASLVLGQNNDFSGDGPSTGTVGFNGPSSVGGGNGLLLVADTNNNRVVVYTPMPYGQVGPTFAMGQSGLGTTVAGCGPAGLTAPNQAATSGNMVLVADSGNHRVLIWNRWPTMSGTSADVALGQTDLASCLPNQGAGLPLASSLSAPQDVWSDQNRMAVADTGNRRVLIWLNLPVITGQAADLAIGQADLLSGGSQTTSATSLNGPVSVVFDNNTLFVADSVDHRVLAFNPFPTVSGASASYALGQHLSTDNLCNQGNVVAAFTLCMPTGVSIVEGDLAVTDSNNNRVLVFYSDPNAAGFGSFSVVASSGGSFLTSLAPPANATAGGAASATVTALSFNGQLNPNYAGTIAFTSTDPNAMLPANYTYTPTDAGVHDFNVTFFRAATHSLAVYDILNGGSRGAAPNVLVVAGSANLLAVTNFPGNPNAGQQASLLVTAYDAWHNVASSFAGTVSFASSDPNAILPAPYTFVSSDAGVHGFAATLVTPGSQTITVNANGLMVQSGTQQNIIVQAPFLALGGAVSGLLTGNVTLTNSVNGDTIHVGNGNYVFDQNIQNHQNYNVGAVPPSGHLCTVANGNGIMGLNGKYNVWVTCTSQTYTLGGSVVGLVAGAQVGLQNSPDIITTSNGNFIFPTGVAYNSNFNASLTNPNGQTCVFTGNSNVGVMPSGVDMNIRVACTPDPYSLGGAITGLLANSNVTLSDGNDIISRANGSYTFVTPLPYMRAYSIAITNPNGQTCIFNPNTVGNGNMPYHAVTNANVTCTTQTYPLGGTVSGLAAGNVTITNTVNTDAISVGNGNYLFDQNIAYAGNYNVIVVSPNGLTCSVSNGNAVMAVGGEFNVSVVCLPRPYMLGGSVSGLLSNTNVTMTDGNDTIAAGNGNFTFPTGVAYNSNFMVALSNPNGQTCAFTSNSNVGVMPPYNDLNVLVTCATQTYLLGGAISGLLTNTNVTLADGNDIVATSNGNFTFPTGVAYNSNFHVSLTNPNGQTCVFTSNSNTGVMPASNDTNVLVTCTTNTYTLGGAISGLLSNTNVTLSDGNDTISHANGPYLFSTLLPYTRAYSITIINPNGQTCAFNPNTVGNGNMPASVVSNANVVCTTNTYPLGGVVTGLVTGNITITNAVNVDVISVRNGNYLFDQNIAYAGNYNVTVASPNGLSCSVANGNAVMAVGGEFNVYIACSPKLYTLGGTISGLVSNTNVALTDGNDTIATSNGNFTFPTSVAYNSNFSVGITNPNGQNCVFTGNSNVGVMPPNDDTNILITCTSNVYTLGGTIRGLLTNTNVTLSDGNDTLNRPSGSYTFPTSLPYARAYSITISNPNGQTCAFNPNTAGNGNMPAASVSNANVVCTTNTYPLGGAVSGLISGNVTLTNTANSDTISVNNGNYLFDQNVAYTGNYNVIATPQAGIACSVANGNAVMAVGGEFNVYVTCVATNHTLGGSISGLVTNTNITLRNGNDTIATTNGNFTFPTGVATNSNFNVSLANPNGQTCVFASNSNAGVMPAVNDMNVLVTCTTNTYSLGGTIIGLLSNTNVTLADGNDTLVHTNGNYTFSTLLPYGRVYSIGIANPNGQTCSFNPNSAGTGTMSTAPVTNANVVCTTNTYPLGGAVTGLVTGNVTLTNTANADTISISNGNYLFDLNVVYAGNYNVVATSPNGQTCTVQNSNAAMPVGGNFNVNVTCVPTSATRLVLSGYTTPRTAGQNGNVNITAYDASNNVAIGYTGTVHLNTTDPNASFSPTFTFVLAYAGSANVPIAMMTSGNQTITGNDTVTPSIAGNQNTIVVNPNAVNHLGLANYTTPRMAGSNSNVTVTIYDFYNNIVPTYTGTVHFTVTDTNALFSPNFTFAASNAGSANVPVTMTRTGTWSITGNDTLTSSIAGIETNIVVTPGNANRYTMTGISNPIYGCQQNNITVTVYDAYANLDTTYTGTIALSSTDPNAVLSPNYTFVTGDMGTKSLPVSLHSVGTWNVSGNDTVTPIVSGSQNGILVKHLSAVSYGLRGYPNPSVAGQQANVTISAYDVCGNLDTNYIGTVHISSTDSSAVLGSNYTFTLADAGVTTRSVLFKTAGNQVINANDTVTAGISGHQNVLVNPNTAIYYTVTGFPSQVNIAAQANIVVTAYDFYNNVGTNYTGTAHVRSTDVNATLPADYTFTLANAGRASLPVRLNSWGTWAISANDTVTNTVSGRESNILVAFTPMTTTPVGTAGLSGYVWHRGNYTGGTDPPQLTDLLAQYAYGVSTQPNDVFVDSYINTTRHFQFSGSLNSATNTYLGSDANGTAAADSTTMNSTSFLFTGYLVVPTGGNYTIACTNADDGAIAYIGGDLQGGNSTLVMLRNWNSSITNAPGYTNPVSLYFNQAGAYPFSIFHFDQGGGAGLDFNIYGPAAVTFLTGPAPWIGSTTHFSLSTSPNPVVAGQPATLTAVALDGNNNVATNYFGTLSLATTDTTSTLPSSYTYTAVNAGVASMTVVFRTSGTWSITGNDSAVPSVAGIQTGIVATNDGNATRFTLNYNNIVAGTQGNILVTAIDASGTVCNNYRGTVAVLTSDPNAALPVNRTFGSGDNGVALVPVTFNQINMNANITVTDTNNSVLTAQFPNILVYPAPNATTPSGSVGLTGRVLHRLNDQSLTGAGVSDLHTAANYLYTHALNYTFTNSNFNSTLALNYNGNDMTPFKTFLGADAAGTAASDSNAVQTTYMDYAGYLKVSTGGNYTFALGATDDAAFFFMGGGTAPGVSTLLLAANFHSSSLLSTFSNPLVLHLPSAGYYPIELFWENQSCGSCGASLRFTISGPGSISLLTGSTIGFFERLPSLAEIDAASHGTDAALNRMVPALTSGEPQLIALLEDGGKSSVSSWTSVFPHLPSADDQSKLTFLSNRNVYRTLSITADILEPGLAATPVLVAEAQDETEAGGVWLLNAVRKRDGTLVGLYRRAERSSVASPNEAMPRFTSAIAWSYDDGRSWVKQGAAVGRAFANPTTETEPEMGCMLYDAIRQRWLGIGHGLGYLSHDPNAAPGTWFGWHEEQFDQPEPDTTGSNLVEPLPGLSEDMDECKLHYNTHLNLFVLLYRPWDGHAIMQSYSPDGVRWAKPTVLMRSTADQKVSHAQIIGESDVLHGRKARLIYRQQGTTDRAPTALMQRPIQFDASPASEPENK